jgi:hypothetical protein
MTGLWRKTDECGIFCGLLFSPPRVWPTTRDVIDLRCSAAKAQRRIGLFRPQTRSNVRLAVVACTVLVTMLVARDGRHRSAPSGPSTGVSAAHTLRDYSGYAARTMGGEVLRRSFGAARAILCPVSGSANRERP